MVQLKGYFTPKLARLAWSFNSKMVQLKEGNGINNGKEYDGFNSKMVQLKGFGRKRISAWQQVSIPKWFN